jgi:hypothetical protein
MLSVDNFYEFFKSYYGWEKTNIIPWILLPYGSKKLEDAVPFLPTHCYDLSQPNNALILHDQESFFHDDSLHIYRDYLMHNRNHCAWQQMTDQELFLHKWRSCSWPIFCHSEKNSSDIKWVENIGCIPCYYFWHGLIARDWFRHWKHHADLDPAKNWQKRFLLYLRDFSGTRSYRVQVKNQLAPFRDQIDSNWEEIHKVNSDFSAKISVQDAQNTAIHLVAETIFSHSKIHVTEKIFKPIVMRQPFIVFAGPGTLDYMRNYGFQTFDSIWDESYDLEQDPEIRMDKILNLIIKLYHKPVDEFQSILDKCKKIVDHNVKHFFGEEFETQMLNELHCNVSAAINEQQRRSKIDTGGSLFFLKDSVSKRRISLSPDLEKIIQNTINISKNLHPEQYQMMKKQYSWC